MAERNSSGTFRATPDPARILSRRQALTAAGALAAAAVATLPAAAQAGSDASGGHVGIAPSPANAVEFRARFVQTGSSGEDFAAYGFLTRAEGTSGSDLFAGTTHDVTTALFTAYASGKLTQRVLDKSVHALDIEGALTIYQRVTAGASFALPNSFQAGLPVARFDITLQDILTVFLPGRGIPTLTGAMRQTLADRLLVGPPVGRQFGRMGSRARFFATGVGDLIDPVTLNAELEMVGNWVVE